ncbi:MAG: hypothetical protein AAF492_09595, partial [Verrucomicrobiota bacterium]
MKQLKTMVCLMSLIALAGSVSGASPIQITATKKTGSKSKSGQQFAPGGASTRLTSKEIFYEFNFRSMSPKLPDSLKAEWAILVEGVGGRHRIAAKGDDTVQLKYGQNIKFQTSSVNLNAREFNTARGSTKLKEDVKGYGVRL